MYRVSVEYSGNIGRIKSFYKQVYTHLFLLSYLMVICQKSTDDF